MSVFGWGFPPGLEHRKDAPWNQDEATCSGCGHVEVDCECKPDDMSDPIEGWD